VQALLQLILHGECARVFLQTLEPRAQVPEQQRYAHFLAFVFSVPAIISLD